jgi:hypothetical protein
MHGAARADSYTGTWRITPSSTPGQVELEMQYRHSDANGNEEWDESHDIPASQIRDNNFTIAEEAGTFHLQGTFSDGQGAGTWSFTPNPNFARELEQRGIQAPSEKEQFQLALGHFTIAELDALLAAGFARPTPAELVRMKEHGINRDYITAMKGLRFASKTVDELVRLHDHGVTPGYIRSLQDFGYSPSANDLVRLHDHGVSAQYIARLRSHGYTNLSADDLIRLHDHGF